MANAYAILSRDAAFRLAVSTSSAYTPRRTGTYTPAENARLKQELGEAARTDGRTFGKPFETNAPGFPRF